MALKEHELRTLDYEPDTGGHFGDYGGLPLKLLWALLTLVTIWVLWTGVMLWLRRGSGHVDRRVSEILQAHPHAANLK